MKRFHSTLLHGLLLAVLVLVPVSVFSNPIQGQKATEPQVEKVRGGVRFGVYYGRPYYRRPYRYYYPYRPYYYRYYYRPYYGYGYRYGW